MSVARCHLAALMIAAAFMTSLSWELPQTCRAGVIETPLAEAPPSGGTAPVQIDPLLPTGRHLQQAAICKGKGGNEFMVCRVSGNGSPPVEVKTNYFQFVAAGWHLTQVVADPDTRLLVYFFEQQRMNR